MSRTRFSSIFMGLALLLTATLAWGATSPRLEMLTKELSLTADQQGEIGPILKQQQAARKKVMANAASAPDGATLKATADAMARRYDAQVEALLTGDQVGKYKALREKEMGGGSTASATAKPPAAAEAPAGPRSMRLEKLTKELSLTEKQQAEIAPLLKRQQAARQKVVANAAGAPDGAALKGTADAMARRFDAQIEGKLTGDQVAKYKALREKELGGGSASTAEAAPATAGTPVSAASGPRNMQLERLTKELSLTEKQQGEIAPILAKKKSAMKMVAKNAGSAQTPEQVKGAADAMARRFDAQVEAKLEGEQVEKYRAMLESEKR